MATSTAKSIVETTTGTVRGAREHGVSAFRGIPYGSDTGGANRFQPPRPPQPWTGVRDATQYGPTAVQVRPRVLPFTQSATTIVVAEVFKMIEGKIMMIQAVMANMPAKTWD